jgi:hypothetical protein
MRILAVVGGLCVLEASSATSSGTQQLQSARIVQLICDAIVQALGAAERTPAGQARVFTVLMTTLIGYLNGISSGEITFDDRFISIITQAGTEYRSPIPQVVQDLPALTELMPYLTRVPDIGKPYVLLVPYRPQDDGHYIGISRIGLRIWRADPEKDMTALAITCSYVVVEGSSVRPLAICDVFHTSYTNTVEYTFCINSEQTYSTVRFNRCTSCNALPDRTQVICGSQDEPCVHEYRTRCVQASDFHPEVERIGPEDTVKQTNAPSADVIVGNRAGHALFEYLGRIPSNIGRRMETFATKYGDAQIQSWYTAAMSEAVITVPAPTAVPSAEQLSKKRSMKPVLITPLVSRQGRTEEKNAPIRRQPLKIFPTQITLTHLGGRPIEAVRVPVGANDNACAMNALGLTKEEDRELRPLFLLWTRIAFVGMGSPVPETDEGLELRRRRDNLFWRAIATRFGNRVEIFNVTRDGVADLVAVHEHAGSIEDLLNGTDFAAIRRPEETVEGLMTLTTQIATRGTNTTVREHPIRIAYEGYHFTPVVEEGQREEYIRRRDANADVQGPPCCTAGLQGWRAWGTDAQNHMLSP